MRAFKNISIRRKILYSILGISIVSLTLGYVLILINTVNDLRNNLTAAANKNAELIAEYSVIPLAFNDQDQAAKNLDVLKRMPDIEKAVIFSSDTSLFASYTKSKNMAIPQPSFMHKATFYKSGFYFIYYPINRDNLHYGTLFLAVSTQKAKNEIRKSIVQFSLLLLFLVILSAVLANLFQKAITSNVFMLVHVMKKITKEQDYSLRVTKSSNDEIGELYDGFNNMLEKIDLAQMELQESENKLSNYIKSAPDGIFVVNRAGRFIDVNDSACRMAGLSKTEFLNKSIIDIINFDAIDNKHLANSFPPSGNDFFTGDVIYQHSKHTQHWNISMVKLSNNEFLGFAKDVTIRKKAEEELKNLRNYLSNIIDSMPSVIIGLDSDLNITQWNNEAKKKFGVTNQDIIGKNLAKCDVKKNIDPEIIKNSIQTKQIKTITKQARIVNNSTVFENITIYPLVAKGFSGAVIRIDDITEMVQMEELMIQSEKMLSVGGLAAGMAHEINNPLAGMVQNTSVIINRLQSDLPGNYKAAKEVGVELEAIKQYMSKRNIFKQLQLINESGQRAARIVQNMLSFARRSESKNIPVSIPEIIDNTLELIENDYDLQKKYDFKYIKINKSYKKDLPLVACESSKIQQVLLNLFRNGADAMASGNNGMQNAEFQINVLQEDKFVRIEIADNGPGIEEDIKSRIFEPFFTTKSVGQGSGLGLSVSYFIITENHRGKMSVNSSPGNGTCFIIHLPIN